GFLPALSLQLGAMLGLVLWAIVALAGGAMLAQDTPVRIALGVFGVLLLLLLMGRALRDAYLNRGTTVEGKSLNSHGDFVVGAVISLANPLPIVMWLSIGTGMISTIDTSPDTMDVLV